MTPKNIPRKIPPKKRTKKRDENSKKKTFRSIFRLVNLKEILRESKSLNPLVEYLRGRQLLLYLEAEERFYSLKEKDREKFAGTEFQKLREQFKQIEATIVRIKRIDSIKQKNEERSVPLHVTWKKIAKIMSFHERADLIHEAMEKRPIVLAKLARLFRKSNLWGK